MVHTVLCTTWIEQKKEKKLWNHYFSAVIWLWLFSNESRILHRKQKTETLIVHIGVFGVLNKVFFQKFTGDVKNTIFLQVFKFFCTCFQNPLFLMLAFPFVGFVFPCFLFYFVLLLFDKSSCYVLVFVFVVLGFLGLVMCYVLCFFWFVFGLVFFLEGLRVRWGGPKGHLTSPLNLLSCFCGLFLVCFCLCWNEPKNLVFFSPPEKGFFSSFVFCLTSLFNVFSLS